MKHIIIVRLETLESQFEKHFCEAESCRRAQIWIQFPFKDNGSDSLSLTASEEDQLKESYLQTARRSVYESRSLIQFWIYCLEKKRNTPAGSKSNQNLLQVFSLLQQCIFVKSESSSLTYQNVLFNSNIYSFSLPKGKVISAVVVIVASSAGSMVTLTLMVHESLFI